MSSSGYDDLPSPRVEKLAFWRMRFRQVQRYAAHLQQNSPGHEHLRQMRNYPAVMADIARLASLDDTPAGEPAWEGNWDTTKSFGSFWSQLTRVGLPVLATEYERDQGE